MIRQGQSTTATVNPDRLQERPSLPRRLRRRRRSAAAAVLAATTKGGQRR